MADPVLDLHDQIQNDLDNLCASIGDQHTWTKQERAAYARIRIRLGRLAKLAKAGA